MQERRLFALVSAKVVGSQRTRVGVDVIEGLIEVPVSADRQQRPEDFFFHAQRVGLRRDNQRGRNLARAVAEVLIRRVQRDDATAALFGIFEIAAETLVVSLVDHCCVLIVVTEI